MKRSRLLLLIINYIYHDNIYLMSPIVDWNLLDVLNKNIRNNYKRIGLMVKCTPERGQKCSLFHLMVKCTPIIVELPSVYRGCKPLICFQ